MAVGAGIGLSAKFAEAGGADLIIIYNSGLYRMDGLSSIAGYMPFGDANAIVKEMGLRHILPIVRNAPVIAGICAYDLTRDMETFLKELLAVGFSGVINFPTVGRIDGDFRQSMADSRNELPEGSRGYGTGWIPRIFHHGLCIQSGGIEDDGR